MSTLAEQIEWAQERVNRAHFRPSTMEMDAAILSSLRSLEAAERDAAEVERICPAPKSFEGELRRAINRWSQENGSDTPDFILASYLVACLDAFGAAVKARDKWFNHDPWGRNVNTIPMEPVR